MPNPITRQARTATPAPIPALAPVESPPLAGTSVRLVLSAGFCADVVGAGVEQNAAVPDWTHSAPLAQHPPPMEEAHLNCPGLQPDWIWETRVVICVVVDVGWQRKFVALVMQAEPRLQQPPPSDGTHWKAKVAVQARVQQAIVVVTVPLMVAVWAHWYLSIEQLR